MHLQQEQEAAKRRVARLTTSNRASENQYLPALGLAATAQRRLSPSAVLALQQTRGNAAVCRMLAAQRQSIVQRDPDPNDEDDQQAQQQPQTSSSATDQPASQPDNTSNTTTLPTDSNAPDATPSDDTNPPSSDNNQSDMPSVDNNQPDTSDTNNADNTTDSGPVTGGPVQGEATPIVVEANGGCDVLDLQGLTQANYGGTFTTSAISYTNVGSDVQATGTITCTYTVSTQVTLPGAPSDLSACETGKVNNAIQTILAPHEQRHVAAFRGYAGRTVRSFSFTLPGMNTSAGAAALDAAVQPQLQAMYDSEQGTRQAASDAASAALDPFNFTVDCSACDQN
ncbi:MAG: hypothetical protein ACYDBJ_09385 [Aggregatilineales bacterium]